MLFTTKARYAVMAVLDIANSCDTKPITLKDIALRQNITAKYLEQIMNKLAKASIVKSVKGPGGGYVIESSQVTIDRIIDAVEESIKITRCSLKDKCMPGNKLCNSHYLWDGLTVQIRKYFRDISIEDMVSGKFKKEFYDKLNTSIII